VGDEARERLCASLLNTHVAKKKEVLVRHENRWTTTSTQASARRGEFGEPVELVKCTAGLSSPEGKSREPAEGGTDSFIKSVGSALRKYRGDEYIENVGGPKRRKEGSPGEDIFKKQKREIGKEIRAKRITREKTVRCKEVKFQQK